MHVQWPQKKSSHGKNGRKIYMFKNNQLDLFHIKYTINISSYGSAFMTFWNLFNMDCDNKIK